MSALRRVATYAAVGTVTLALFLVPPHRALDDLAVPDGEEYAVAAFNLATTGRYQIVLDGEGHPPRYPAGYPLLIAAANGAARPALANAVHVNVALGITTALLVLAAGRLWSPGIGLLAAALLLTSRSFFFYTHWILSETLLMFLFAAHAYLLARSAKGRSASWAAAAGLAAGYAAATRIAALAILCPAALVAAACRRPRTARLAAYGAGVAAVAAPLLLHNHRTFGHPLRSGYQYWCSNPYDVLGNTFSITYLVANSTPLAYLGHFHAFLREGTGALLGAGGALEWPQSLLAWIVTATFYLGCVAAWRRDGGERRAWTMAAAATAIGVWGLYSFYFLTADRFLVPLLPLACVPLAHGAVELGRAARRAAWPIRLAAVACLAFWTVALASRARTLVDVRARFATASPPVLETFMQRADALLEPDAVLVSNLSAPIIHHYLQRGRARRYRPLDRSVEYAAKFAQPLPPVDPGRIPHRRPFDHTYAGALENGARHVFATTFREAPATAADLRPDHRPIYLLLDQRRSRMPKLEPALAAEERLRIGHLLLLQLVPAP